MPCIVEKIFELRVCQFTNIEKEKKICLPGSMSRAVGDISGERLIRIYPDGGEQHSYA